MKNGLTQQWKWLVALLIVTATVYCYWDVRSYDFVNYDDGKYIYSNMHVQQGLNVSSIAWSFTSLYMANWHPLTWISYIIDHEAYGLNPGGFHVTSVLIHILNCVLLFLILHRLTDRFWPSAIIGLLFAIHPMHVESVAWISERKDVLSTLFMLATIFAYSEYVKLKTAGWYAATVLLFLSGLMAKPMLVTLPFILLLLDHWPLGRLAIDASSGKNLGMEFLKAYFRKANTGLWKEKIPLFALAAGSAIITIIAQKGSGAISAAGKLSLLDRSLNAIHSYGMYIYKTFIPTDLAVFYPYPKAMSITVVIGIAIALLTVSYLALRNAKKLPFFVTGWLLFLGTLVPVIGLMQVGSQAMADRYTYIPHIGLFIAIVFLFAELTRPLRFRAVLGSVLAIIICLLLIVSTRTQVKTWENNETLYTHAIAVTAGNRTANHNLAAHYMDLQNYDKALYYARNAIRLNPGSASAHHNVGLAFENIGILDSALFYYDKTLKLKPSHSATYAQLGNVLLALGQTDRAHKYYVKAVEYDPSSAINQNTLGAFYLKTGQPERAPEYFTKAMELDPSYTLPLDNMALFFLNTGQYEKAERFLDHSLSIKPLNPVANKYKGDMHILRGRYDSALAYFTAALYMQPMNRDLHMRIQSILNREDIDSLATAYKYAAGVRQTSSK